MVKICVKFDPDIFSQPATPFLCWEMVERSECRAGRKGGEKSGSRQKKRQCCGRVSSVGLWSSFTGSNSLENTHNALYGHAHTNTNSQVVGVESRRICNKKKDVGLFPHFIQHRQATFRVIGPGYEGKLFVLLLFQLSWVGAASTVEAACGYDGVDVCNLFLV